jgi:hypothetical protein
MQQGTCCCIQQSSIWLLPLLLCMLWLQLFALLAYVMLLLCGSCAGERDPEGSLLAESLHLDWCAGMVEVCGGCRTSVQNR